MKQQRRRRMLLLLLTSSATGSASAYAQLPTGAEVVAGQAAVANAGNTMDVTASTHRAIVNWDSFSVGAGNAANFNLPSADSAILNRVMSDNMASTIAGRITSNGHVLLVNPSGVMVSSTGMVNTNGFTASTFDVTNHAFMSGGSLAFTNNGSDASVVNEGTINTGQVGAHLIANQIANHGTIASEGGNITMSGGGHVTLENGITYVQPTMETLTNGLSPTAGMIQSTGAIRATGAATRGGDVFLVNPNGKILHDGTIQSHLSKDESSVLPGTSPVDQKATLGGHVQLEADEITLTSNSVIDATGTHGGGDVLVGGDWQGSGDMHQATTVTMDAGATIDASAIECGDGGKIVLWSEVHNPGSVTKANGTLVARAGDLSGDGGQIETSGQRIKTDGISVDGSAANGAGGQWLIDPYNYVIDSSAANNIVAALESGTSVTVTTTSYNSSFGASGSSSALGDITVASDIVTGVMSGDATLTLRAARHIDVQGDIDATQDGNTRALNVRLFADTDNSGDGISIIRAETIRTNGGNLQFGAGSTINIGGANVKVGGDVYLTGAQAQSIETDGGVITINGETIVANSSVSGVTFDSGGGNILFGGAFDSGNQYTYVDGPNGQSNSWDWSRTDARNGTAGGSLLGESYLVTITSRLENAIAGITADYRGAWIGAHRPSGNSWRWIDGPEGGQTFFVANSNVGGGTTQSGWYSNFGFGEPNGQISSGEDKGQFFGNEGLWNDLSSNTPFLSYQQSEYAVLGYVRETNLAPTAVSVNAGSGGVTFGGGIGGGKALASLDVTSTSTDLNGNTLITTGTQNYSSALTINATAGIKIDATTLTTAGGLNVVAADDVTLGAMINTVGDVSITGDAISLSGNQSIDAGVGDITLNVDDVDGGFLSLDTTGHFTFAPKSNAWDPLGVGGQLDYAGTQSGDTFTGSGDVAWLKFNDYSTLGGLTLGKAGTTSSIYVYDPINIAGPVNLSGNFVTVAAGIDTSSSAGGAINLDASGNIVIAADQSLTTNGGDITFDGTVNSNGIARNLIISPGTADAIFNGDVGSTAALSSLTVNGTANVNADITTAGAQSWTDTITLGGSGTRTLSAETLATQAIVGGSKDFQLIADDLTMGGDVASTGSIVIAPKTAGTDIGIGNISGTFSFNNADFASLQDGFSSVTIGNVASGDVVVGGLTSVTDHLTLQAGSTSDLFVNSSLAWSEDNTLTLAAGRDIFVNSNIDVSGAAGGLNLYYGGTDGSSAPSSGNGYFIDVANRRRIRFAETTSGLELGNESFTLVDSASALQSMSASGRYALASELDLSGTTHTDAFYATTFTGKLDGLGHEIDGLTLRANNGGNFGLFGQFGGATIRHLGVTNIDILGQSTSNAAADDLRIGGIVGNVSGSGTTLLDGVWTTGVIATKQGSLQDVFYAGGIAGGHDSGTLNIVRSFSTTNISSQGSHSQKLGIGGLVGDSGDHNGSSSIGGFSEHLWIDRSYANGAIVEGTYAGYFGSGGLVGVGYGQSVKVTDSFSQSNVVGGLSSGGLVGVIGNWGTYDFRRNYTTLDRFGNGLTVNNSYKSDTLDAATVNGTQLPSGWSSEIWGIGDLPTLKAVGIPASLLYVQILGGTGVYGDLAVPNYQIVDTDGNVVTFGTGDYTGLDGISGTGRYTLGQFTSVGTYNSVSYLSGLGLTGDDANLFALNPYTTAGSFTITPRGITAVLGNTGVDKVYDGTVNAKSGYSPTWSFTNLVPGDTVTLNTGSSQFNDADVLDANLFTVHGLSLAGISGSNGSQASDYSLANTTASVAANITPKSLVIGGLFAVDKIYDATTTAFVDSSSATFNGIVSGDSVSLTGVTGAFADTHVGADKTVTITVVFAGADASNYSATAPSLLNADITPKSLTVSGITAVDKVYDGTTAATVDGSGASFSGLVAGDDLAIDTLSGLFSDKNVADGKPVNLTTTYTGADASNYAITDQSIAVGNITPKSVTVSGLIANNRVYDGTTSTTVDHSGVVFGGMISGDQLSASSTAGILADKNVGTGKAVTLSGTSYGGMDAGNYTFIDQAASTADISAKAITVTGIGANNKVYDGTTSATVDFSGLNFSGIVSGDHLTASGTTGTFDNKNTGEGKTVVLSGTNYGGTDAGNYSFTDQASTTADITSRSVTVSGLIANDRVYDGTTTTTVDHGGATFAGMIGGDDLSASGTVATFADKNVRTAKAATLAGTTYGGADVGNYVFTDQTTSTADVTQRALIVSGITAADKTYDATTDVTVDHSTAQFSGLVAGDVFSIDSLVGNFTDKNASTGKVVDLSTTYAGDDVGNYTITDQTTAAASITPLSVSVSGVSATNKVYDTTRIATLGGTAIVNTLSGDTVTLEANYTANFTGPNVADGIAVNVDGFALTGTDASNYLLAQPTGLSANITPAPLVITANNDSKFVTQSDITGYAGATFDGFVGSEGVDDLAGSLAIIRNGTDEAAGTYTGVLVASGLSNPNYDISFINGGFTIVPAEQFLIRFGNSDTTYGDSLGFDFLSAEYMDASHVISSLTPTVNGNDYSFDDGVGGTVSFTLGLENPSLSTSGHANVGTYGLAMAGLNTVGGNFSHNLNLSGSHTIQRANLSSGAGGVSKTYDGNTQMNNLTLNITGLVAGDAVNISGQGSYSDRNAGSGLSYRIENLSLDGSDADNYVLPGGTTLHGNDGVITAKRVTIDGPSVTKVYDGHLGIAATATQLQDWTTQLGVIGDTVDGITLSYDDKNVGNGKTLTPSAISINDGNGGGNYSITFADDTTSRITRLGSVTWIGGATGDWNDPANWAGGAVPDLANVANVIIPLGVTPTFGTNVAGPVQIDSFTGGNLQLDGGTLNVDGNLTADVLTQNGGTLQSETVQANDFTQTAGTVNVDDTFTVNHSFTQSPTASIDVGGQVDITHTTGVLTINNVSRGAVKLNSTNGGVHIVNIAAGGDLDIIAAGDVTQDNTGTLTAAGNTNLTSTGNVNLGGPDNDFTGPVNVTATNATLADSDGGLQLGNVSTTGSLDVTTIGGDLTQSTTSQVNVGTTTTLHTTGEVILNGPQNQLQGSVNINADTAEIVQSVGDLVLGVLDIARDLTVQSAGASVLQTPTGSIAVGDESTFVARREIKLQNSGNEFTGAVQVDAPVFRLKSQTALTLTKTGAALADEATARQAQTVNDTFIRPAATKDTSTGTMANSVVTWRDKFTDFVAGLFRDPSAATPSAPVVRADVAVENDDVFIRNRREP